MKRILPLFFLAAALLLTACGQKPVFGVSTNADNSISITADRGPKDSMGIGYLTVGAGEQVVIDATGLNKGAKLSLRFMAGVLGSDDFPDEPAYKTTVSGGDSASFTAGPGEYTVGIVAQSKVTGSARIYAEAAEGPETAAITGTEPEGQNPVMNFVGVYSTEYSTEALVAADGTENAKITVTYAGDPWFRDVTVMSGYFDPATLSIEFSNAALTEYTYNSDGSVATESVSYTDGKGHAVFHPTDNTLTITEEFESGDYETVFRWGPASNMMAVTDPDHYAGVTAMDKYQVEGVVAFQVRTAYLTENWYALADMIRYPIEISGILIPDSVAFIEYMKDKTVAEEYLQAMYDENCRDMSVNDQGIVMGNGGILLGDPNYGTDAEPVLEITAINGIVDR